MEASWGDENMNSVAQMRSSIFTYLLHSIRWLVCDKQLKLCMNFFTRIAWHWDSITRLIMNVDWPFSRPSFQMNNEKKTVLFVTNECGNFDFQRANNITTSGSNTSSITKSLFPALILLKTCINRFLQWINSLLLDSLFLYIFFFCLFWTQKCFPILCVPIYMPGTS